jgi:hypothetical protein
MDALASSAWRKEDAAYPNRAGSADFEPTFIAKAFSRSFQAGP